MSASRQCLERFVADLIDEEKYDNEEGVWLFADGRPCSVCFSSAQRIARAFDGEVIGFWLKANPTAAICGTLGEGHDFALIARRWIVDYWAFRIARVMQTPVLDLHSPHDEHLASHLFGNREAWEVLAA